MSDGAGCYCCRPRVPYHLKIVCSSLAAGAVKHVPDGIGTKFAQEPTFTLTNERPQPPTGEELPQGEMPCVEHLHKETTNKDLVVNTSVMGWFQSKTYPQCAECADCTNMSRQLLH